MGTVINQHAFGRRAGEAQRAADSELRRLEDLLSRFRPGSEISEINRRAGRSAVQVSRDTYQVLLRAAEFSALSKGAFDVTVGPLVSLWQLGKGEGKVPRQEDIDRALALVGHSDLVADCEAQTVRLTRPGQSIDLGGIGKGYAGDRLRDVYKRHDISSALLNLGGNVVALGARPDGSPWRIGIRHPRNEDVLLGRLAVTDRAVVTSGDYQRFFLDRDGRRCHHLLDPCTGYPSESGLSSVTIVARSGCVADALSTAVFVSGLEQGLALVRACPGAEAIVVDTASRVYVTSGLRDHFEAAAAVSVTLMGGKETQQWPSKHVGGEGR
jgi:thiamine biosynthesis lipoprotein